MGEPLASFLSSGQFYARPARPSDGLRCQACQSANATGQKALSARLTPRLERCESQARGDTSPVLPLFRGSANS